MKKIFALTVLTICLLASTALASNAIVATYFVVNCKESITLRETPSVYARELAQIPLGQAIGFIEDAPNGFCKVNYDGIVGYALADYLSPNRQRTATVVNCRVAITLRVSPTVEARGIMEIPLGAKVEFLGDASDDFYQVKYRGVLGYVLKTYIALD